MLLLLIGRRRRRRGVGGGRGGVGSNQSHRPWHQWRGWMGIQVESPVHVCVCVCLWERESFFIGTSLFFILCWKKIFLCVFVCFIYICFGVVVFVSLVAPVQVYHQIVSAKSKFSEREKFCNLLRGFQSSEIFGGFCAYKIKCNSLSDYIQLIHFINCTILID